MARLPTGLGGKEPTDLYTRALAILGAVNPSSRVSRAVRVKTAKSGLRTETRVSISDRYPAFGGDATLEVTTDGLRLPSDRFRDLQAREKIQATRHKDKGRVAYFVLNGEVLAAISFHVDSARSVPFLVRAVAVRDDSTEARAVAVAAAAILTAYIQEASRKDNREGRLGMLLEKTQDPTPARTIGFKPAAAPAAVSLDGRRYLALDEAGDQ